MSKSISSSFVEEEGRQESLHLQNCITPLDTWDTQKNQLNGILLQVCNWNTGHWESYCLQYFAFIDDNTKWDFCKILK